MAELSTLHHWRIFEDAELERIRGAAFRVLHESGFRILNREVIAKLAALGFRVDHAACAVFPTPVQLARLEAVARAGAGVPREEPVLRRPLPPGEHVGHNYTTYYDYTEGVRRPASLADIRNVVKAWHVLPEVTATGPCMTAQDVPTEIEPIVGAVETMRLTDKIHGCPELMLAPQLPYLEALETILAGREVKYHVNGCSVNHFTLDARAADCLLAVAQNGLERWWINSCPIAGANAPVTLAGAVVVGVAETLGGWLAGYALNPDVALGAIPLSGVMDMRTTRAMFSTPESILMDSALYQYFYRFCDLRIGLCIGYTDAKVPGMQAINDKLLKALGYGWFTDALGGQTGTLEAGNTYSPTQQVIDFELNRQAAQLARGMPVTDETLAVDAIIGFAPDDADSFLMQRHTVAHWREALWRPALMDRTSSEDPAAERAKETQILDRAEARWRDALAVYHAPDLDAGKLRAAEEVLAHARRHLL